LNKKTQAATLGILHEQLQIMDNATDFGEFLIVTPPPGKADQSPYGGKGNPEKCSPRKNTLSVGVALCKISIHADSTRAEIPERQKDIVHLFHLSFTLIWLISF